MTPTVEHPFSNAFFAASIAAYFAPTAPIDLSPSTKEQDPFSFVIYGLAVGLIIPL